MTLWYTKNYSPTPHFPFESFLRNPDKILFDPMTQETPSKYPLTNIGYANNTLIFEVALAGFKKENIKVSYVGNVITVNAKWNKDSEEQTCPQCEAQGCDGCDSCCKCECDCCKKEIKYIMKNISTKDACRKFTLPDKYLGGSLKWKFVDGLLTIAVYVNDVDYSVEPSEDDEDLIPDCGCGCSQGCLCHSDTEEQSDPQEPQNP